MHNKCHSGKLRYLGIWQAAMGLAQYLRIRFVPRCQQVHGAISRRPNVRFGPEILINFTCRPQEIGNTKLQLMQKG